MTAKTFVDFKQDTSVTTTRKTFIYDVTSVANGTYLGRVYFKPQWRKYVFEPNERTLYDAVCLSQIAGFCDAQTDAWRRP